MSYDLQPADTCEEILVEKIAMAYWRLHVAYGFEADFSRTANRFLGTCDRTGRYAYTIHRQLMQDLSALERLQQRRSGEVVPAPISVDINVSGLETDCLTGEPNVMSDMPEIMVVAGSDELNLDSLPSSKEAKGIKAGRAPTKFGQTNPPPDRKAREGSFGGCGPSPPPPKRSTVHSEPPSRPAGGRRYRHGHETGARPFLSPFRPTALILNPLSLLR